MALQYRTIDNTPTLTQGVAVSFRGERSGMRLKIPLAFAVPASQRSINQALVLESTYPSAGSTLYPPQRPVLELKASHIFS